MTNSQGKKKKKKDTRGRPTELTPTVIKSLLKSVSIGLSYTDACIIAGIKYRTFQGYKRQAEAEEDAGAPGYFSNFYDKLMKARIKGKRALIESLNSDGESNSKKWLLERLYPSEFAKKIEPSENVKDELLQDLARAIIEADGKTE